jgi:hypothetical protein
MQHGVDHKSTTIEKNTKEKVNFDSLPICLLAGSCQPNRPPVTSWHEDWFKLTTFSLRLLVAVSDPLQLKMELKVPCH